MLLHLNGDSICGGALCNNFVRRGLNEALIMQSTEKMAEHRDDFLKIILVESCGDIPIGSY